MDQRAPYDRRAHVRFIPKENAFAALGPDYSKVGKIRDISKGGLAFEYITKNNSKSSYNVIDIFLKENGFHMSRVPCRQVLDSPIAGREQVFGFGVLTSKRCSVEFKKLSNEHSEQLNKFLKVHIKGVAPVRF